MNINKKPIISMVAAMDKNRGIGYQNKIPWHIKDDLLRFKNLTLGKTIIIGRKTYESLIAYYQKSGRPMPERNMIVISNKSNKSNESNKTYWTNSVDQALALAKKIEPVEVFFAGGASIFAEGIKYATKLYLTIIDGEYKTDTYFPDYSDFKNKVFEENRTSGDFKYKFIDFVK